MSAHDQARHPQRTTIYWHTLRPYPTIWSEYSKRYHQFAHHPKSVSPFALLTLDRAWHPVPSRPLLSAVRLQSRCTRRRRACGWTVDVVDVPSPLPVPAKPPSRGGHAVCGPAVHRPDPSSSRFHSISDNPFPISV